MLTLDKRSLAILQGVHPDIQKVVNKYLEIGTMPITIIEGMRTLETQKRYVKKGVSKTLRSRHLTGHAIDIAPLSGGKPSFAWPLYHKFAPEFKQAAKLAGVPLEWGGDWVKFKDGPHWQLPWKKYPALMGASMAASLEGEDEMGDLSENAYKIQQTGMIGGAGAMGAADGLSTVAYQLSTQQDELSSGDVVRIVIAVVVVALTIAGIVWTWKR